MALNFLTGIDSRVAAAPGAPSTAELQPGRELANFMRLHENDIADMNRQALSAWG